MKRVLFLVSALLAGQSWAADLISIYREAAVMKILIVDDEKNIRTRH